MSTEDKVIKRYVCVLNRSLNCSLVRGMDGGIMRCGTNGSYQSAAISEIVKRFCLESAC